MNRKYFSGLRRMEGEDLDYGDRLYKQKLQQRLWLEEQKRQQDAKAELERQEKDRLAQFNDTMNQLWDKAESQTQLKQFEMERAMQSANSQLMVEKLNREEALRRTEDEERASHIAYTTGHPFFTEDPATMQSQLAPHRVLPYHFKGMNDQQLQAIFDEQKRQVDEKAKKRQQELEQQRLEARESENQRRAALLFERQIANKAQRVKNENRDYLKTQMLEHGVKETDPYNEQGRDFLIPK